MGFFNEMQTALDLASRGLLVFPCYDSPGEERDKRPACRHGHLEATTDPEIIKSWWWHGRLIGTPTGAITRTLVVDSDPRHGGDQWEKANAHRLPTTRMHRTRSGGTHRLYQHPGFRVSNSVSAIAAGIDIRGDGGYIIMWPVHGIPAINDAPLAPLPDWLRTILWLRAQRETEVHPLMPAQPVQRIPDRFAIERLLQFVADSEEGERNSRLFWAACRMGEMIMPPLLDEARAVALLVNATEVTGTSLHEAQKTALSGLHTAAKRRAVT
jgi:hypothetical protein